MGLSILCILCVIGAAATAKAPGGNQNLPMLRGVNRSGTEYACIQGNGIFDSPYDDATIKNMMKWNINVVRVPLNEDCWLGKNVKAVYGGENYQKAIKKWVERLRNHKLYVILELHWSEGLYKAEGSCNDHAAMCQKPMPDYDFAPIFWESVANMFKSDEGIIFDLFNEPFPEKVISNIDQAWKCWRDGDSECPGFIYKVAGMKHLIDAVRKTGAKNLIMLGGLRYANDLERWLDYLPKDPIDNLAASMHSYNFNSCTDKDCWDKGIGKIIASHPVIVGEIGEDDCTHEYIDKLMPYLDERKIHYLAWTWNNWNCKTGPSLISDYNGQPTNFGIGFRDHLKTTVQLLSDNQ